MVTRSNLAEKKRFLSLVRQMRLDAGLRQEDLARKLGEPQSFVSRYESGDRRLDVLELRQICEVLGDSLADFIKRLDGDPD
jgi:transcriptional regulator with XRE-family HTH domain